MKIIPVIDLKAGQVVHAVRGQRTGYQAIDRISQLTDSSEPESVIRDFLKLYPFNCFYLADLDAICGVGHHRELIERLLQRFPTFEFWIDDGTQLSEIQSQQSNRKSVIGTESQRCEPFVLDRDYVLSLDFNQQALGDPRWFRESRYWPTTVILMTLSRVGSNSGPDWQMLKELATSHPEKNIIAAGGVRNLDDLIELAKVPVAGVLMATALHTGKLGSHEIAEFQAKKYPG